MHLPRLSLLPNLNHIVFKTKKLLLYKNHILCILFTDDDDDNEDSGWSRSEGSETSASAPEPSPPPTRARLLTDRILHSQKEKICSIDNLAMELSGQ